MSDSENRPQEPETEEETSTADTASADSPDPETTEGDPPIIIQGGGSGNPS
ncbi:MAG TPA: hypothetical protein VF703_03545 [Pyrinomonadaceae bacterium]|jgi:hypothetical protein